VQLRPARYFGWSEVAYRHHENGTRGFGRKAEEYARAYKVTLDWLMTGSEKAMLKVDERNKSSGLVVRHIPIIPLDSVVGAIESNIMPNAIMGYVPVASAEPLGLSLKAIRLEDDAMRDVKGVSDESFPRGTFCVFDPDASVSAGEYCLAVVKGEELPVFRRYMEESLSVVRLEPLNPAHKTYWIKEDSPGKVLARLVFSLKKH
jgi:SOS-response transcriptional repressor LexA